MLSVKQYIEELYTIGHTRSYDASANRAKRNVEHGSKDPLDHKFGVKSAGGVAFKTVKDARKGAKDMKKDFPGRKYSIYKMKGEFGKDTHHDKETGYHAVKKDTEITHKVVHNASEE